MDSDPEITWNVIEKLFRDDEHMLVRHHLDSYNDFYGKGIYSIFREKNPIVLQKEQDLASGEFRNRCELYLGGRNGDLIYYGKPVIYDDNNEHYMFPNEARLRNMTYGISIHYDVEVIFKIYDDEEQKVKETVSVINKILLGRFPIMVQSNLCILHGMDAMARFHLGECKNDHGGYFIIDGKEKVIVSQEKFADNMMYIRENGEDDVYSHAADVRMVSEDASKPVRTLSVRIVAPDSKHSNNNIVVNIPNVRAPIPLFIVMRALGVLSDHDIIEHCLLDLEENADMVDLFIPCIHDANKIFTQENALKFIATFTKSKTIPQVHEILMNYFLPQVGESNYLQKAYYLGRMVYKLLLVFTGIEPPTDRDSFKFKRIELSGSLIYDLFKEYFTLQQQNIRLAIDREYTLKPGRYEKHFISLIELNYQDFFKECIVESGFKKAFKGNWGASDHTSRVGVIQDLNRLSYNSAISHLRKINLPMDASAKIVKPRMLHNSQWGMIDFVDSPDGANIGFHKHLAMATRVTNGCSAYPMMKWMREVVKMHLLDECTRMFLHYTTKVIINGTWVGALTRPEEAMRVMKLHRRNALIPIYTSISWDIKTNEIHIYTDAGRLCRPLYYIDEDTKKPSYDKAEIIEMLKNKKFTWDNLITGFTAKSDPAFVPSHCNYYTIEELYARSMDTSVLAARKEVSPEVAHANAAEDFKRLRSTMAILEYLDTSETETALISMSHQLQPNSLYTHVEIHPSLILGVMGNQIAFPENNPLARDVFGCGQAKQAASLYHSNYQVRIDKMGVVINNGDIPIVKSRYLDLINHEQHPCGFNAVVAIMSYNGYNVEDSILFNEASIKRGMFRITYYNMYEAYEQSSKVAGVTTDSRFVNVNDENILNLKDGYDYSHLNKHGLIEENTELDDKKVVIGVGMLSTDSPMRDNSVVPKKGQLGFVDKAFMTEGEAGFRIAKVRVREERLPNIGDKFCSRCGQKGTCGLIIPEQDMPFTAEGIRPDIIINPHAIPTRMTIGQLIESLMGKACVMHGAFGECTAFMNNGPRQETFGQILTNYGFHSSGTQVLYNGMTGEEIKSDIFIGPTYYMRLKQMVKDKINYRAQGPRTQLTRQTVQGRANDGGLRIGEMERDGILAHGAMHFLTESMMVRGDEYYMAVCNKSGMIAIYNQDKNLFMSPMVDGPIKFDGSVNDKMTVSNVTKFGRSFSIVRIPYSLKLLIQELQVMNVQMRIITEDNIDQLPSMSYSNNVFKVLHDERADMTIDALINKNRKSVGLNVIDKLEEEEREHVELAGDITPRLPFEMSQSVTYNGRFISKEDETLIMSVDPETRMNVERLGWEFTVSRPKKTRNNNEQPAPQLMLQSIILDKNGEPTEEWVISGREWNGEYPNRYPEGWISSMLMYYDKTPISPEVMVEQLKKNRVSNNWIVAIGYIVFHNHGKPGSASSISPEYAKLNEIHQAEIALARARRENNFAEEEKVKSQIDRLSSELKDIRDKEYEQREVIMTPDYTPTTPLTPEQQERARQYNENLANYYKENPSEIPAITPAPLTPEYTSLFTPPQQQQQPQPQPQPQQGGGIPQLQFGGLPQQQPQQPQQPPQMFTTTMPLMATMNVAPTAMMNYQQSVSGGAGGNGNNTNNTSSSNSRSSTSNNAATNPQNGGEGGGVKKMTINM
jgi:DNA-directed RNA polymerase II subunit RPB2